MVKEKSKIGSQTHSKLTNKNKIPFNSGNNQKINKYFTPTRERKLTSDEVNKGEWSLKVLINFNVSVPFEKDFNKSKLVFCL